MTPRISLFAIVLILFGAVIKGAEAQICPILPSPVIPSHRLAMKAASNPKGAEPLAQEYNSGDPSQDEQYYLELLNRARMNPPAAGVEISNTTDPDVSFEFTYWDAQDANEPTRDSIKSDFAKYQPKQPLAMNASLLAAARAHSQDMLDNNYQGHQGTDGSWPWDRAQKAGYPSLYPGTSPYVGENAAAYARSVYDAYAGWLIDFGVPNDTQYGHRNNCLEFKTGSDSINPGYTECGPGMISDPGAGYPTHTGPLVSTLDLGDAGKHFILGVVYNDLNKNGLYDPGEGVAGVRIDVPGAAYYAVSATQGGYAIPYSGANGMVTVTASGGPFSTPVAKTVDFEGENVKVDFIVGGATNAITLLTPVADTIINQTAEQFTWTAVTGATEYNIQIGTDSAMTALQVNDSTAKTPSYQATGLKNTQTYYWRVRAKSAEGWGDFSAVQAFTVLFPPSAVTLITPVINAHVVDTATFTWQPASGVTRYWLQVSKNFSITSPFTISDTLDAPLTTDTASLARLHAGTIYYWQVLAGNEGGWSAPSTVRSFTMEAASVHSPVAIGASTVRISPNPTTGVVHIEFTLAASGNTRLSVFNNAGEQVKAIAMGMRSAGLNEYDFDGSSLPAGTYSLELRVGSRIQTGRIVLIK